MARWENSLCQGFEDGVRAARTGGPLVFDLPLIEAGLISKGLGLERKAMLQTEAVIQ